MTRSDFVHCDQQGYQRAWWGSSPRRWGSLATAVGSATRMDLADRVVGSALGLALGDALGAPFEFLRARNVPDPIPALERPWLGEPAGSTPTTPRWRGT